MARLRRLLFTSQQGVSAEAGEGAGVDHEQDSVAAGDNHLREHNTHKRTCQMEGYAVIPF
jgi:hypothetical protein